MSNSRHTDNQKNYNISKTIWPILMKFCTVVYITPPQPERSQIQISKNPRWQTDFHFRHHSIPPQQNCSKLGYRIKTHHTKYSKGVFISQIHLTHTHRNWPHSSKLSGCEATQFAMAMTNHNAVSNAAHIKANSESRDDPCDMAKTGRYPIIMFSLVTATANWLTLQPVQMKWGHLR